MSKILHIRVWSCFSLSPQLDFFELPTSEKDARARAACSCFALRPAATVCLCVCVCEILILQWDSIPGSLEGSFGRQNPHEKGGCLSHRNELTVEQLGSLFLPPVWLLLLFWVLVHSKAAKRTPPDKVSGSWTTQDTSLKEHLNLNYFLLLACSVNVTGSRQDTL